MSDRCRSCEAPIEWAITEKGRRIPLDVDDGQPGNIVITADGVAHVVADGEGTHRTHFSTCPNAGVHRKKRSRR